MAEVLVNEHVQNLIEGLSPLWIDRMGLNHWGIAHYFLDTLYVAEPVTNNFMVVADTECEWSYMSARINWYLPSAIRKDDAYLEHVLVHELCHVALSPEQSLIDTYVEKAQEGEGPQERTLLEKLMYERLEAATENMTKVVMRVYRV